MINKPPILAFLNKQGEITSASLLYHTACIMEDMDLRVLVCDLDPQARLTASFLDDEALERLWVDDSGAPTTVFRCVKPLADAGDAKRPTLHVMSDNLALLPGDLELAGFERHIASAWVDVREAEKAKRAMQMVSAFWQVAQWGAEEVGANIILLDVGPDFGAINHSALIASDGFITPLGADPLSLLGMRNLGAATHRWRKEWESLRDTYAQVIDFPLPAGGMRPIGYILAHPNPYRFDRPVQIYEKWLKRLPNDYCQLILGEPQPASPAKGLEEDPNYLLKAMPYRSLSIFAEEAHKPIFRLTAADGATGNHALARHKARQDFKNLADKIIQRMDIQIPAED